MKEKLAKAEAMLEDGAGYAETHRTTGLAVRTLRRHFPGKGMDLREAAQLGKATSMMNRMVFR